MSSQNTSVSWNYHKVNKKVLCYPNSMMFFLKILHLYIRASLGIHF